MSYYVVDAHGFLGDVASIGGLASFRTWALAQPDPIASFARDGETDDPIALGSALSTTHAADSSVDSVREHLAAFATIASGVLILTDGSAGEDEHISASEMFDLADKAAAGAEGRDAIANGDVARRAWVVRRENMKKAQEAARRGQGKGKAAAKKMKIVAAKPVAPKAAPAPPAPTPPTPAERAAQAAKEQAAAAALDKARGPAWNAPGGQVPQTIIPPLPNPFDDTLVKPIDQTAKEAETLGGGHANEAVQVEFADGSTVVFKPVEGEHLLHVRREINNPLASLAEREVLASRVDKALGLGVVPTTLMANVSENGKPPRVGSAQAFVADADLGERITDRQAAAKMAILDVIIGNVDRHGNNYLQTADGKLSAIDNGYSFGESPVGGRLRSVALFGSALGVYDGIRAGDLSHEAQRAIGEKLRDIDWNKALHGAHLSARERETLMERTQTVVTRLLAGEMHKLRTDFKNFDKPRRLMRRRRFAWR